jgi:hypothetical protein
MMTTTAKDKALASRTQARLRRKGAKDAVVTVMRRPGLVSLTVTRQGVLAQWVGEDSLPRLRAEASLIDVVDGNVTWLG